MSEKALTGRLREEGLSTDRPQAVPSVLPVDSARRGNARYLPSMGERMWGGREELWKPPPLSKKKADIHQTLRCQPSCSFRRRSDRRFVTGGKSQALS